MHDLKLPSDKGKQVVVEQSPGLFICESSTQIATMFPVASTVTALEPIEHVETSNESSRTLNGTPSRSEQSASDASVTRDKNQQRRDRDKARRDRLTSEEREEMNARRRAARRNKSIEERNATQRAARQKLTAKEKQEMNARRREASKNKPAEEKQEMNARRRARRQSIPPKERQALRAQRNARLAAKRNTPCAESIAMPRPGYESLCLLYRRGEGGRR